MGQRQPSRSDLMGQWLNRKYAQGSFTFTRNGAPAHASAHSKNYVYEKLDKEHFWDKDSWLPASPDLDPCDFVMVNFGAKDLLQTISETRSALGALGCLGKWHQGRFGQKACSSVYRRVHAVSKTNGGRIHGKKSALHYDDENHADC